MRVDALYMCVDAFYIRSDTFYMHFEMCIFVWRCLCYHFRIVDFIVLVVCLLALLLVWLK